MRSLLVPLLLSPLVAVAAGCQSPVDATEQSLIAKCAIAIPDVVAGPGGGGIATDPGPGPGSGGPGPGGPGLPTKTDACPVCRDAAGNPLPPSACVVHDGVCMIEDPNPGADAARVTQTLEVLQHATHSPAIAYYGACDGNGKTCEARDFAYELIGNELAVATFSGGTTTVYAIPAGATAVRASEPIFPLLPITAGFRNLDVHVVFRTAAGATVDGYGDMQNDCRVVADDGRAPPADVPCWCTQC